MAAPAVVWRGRGRGGGGGSRPRHRAAPAPRGEGAAEIEGGRTSVSCPLMASICSWRPAMVANKDAWSVILLAAFCLRCCALKEKRHELARFWASTLNLGGRVCSFLRLLGSGAAGAAPDILLEARSPKTRLGSSSWQAVLSAAARSVRFKAYASQYALSLVV